eukprot:182705-Chlamydomonas_euryale.AAC.11
MRRDLKPDAGRRNGANTQRRHNHAFRSDKKCKGTPSVSVRRCTEYPVRSAVRCRTATGAQPLLRSAVGCVKCMSAHRYEVIILNCLEGVPG